MVAEAHTKSDGVDILIEDQGQRNSEVKNVEALGTNVVGKDLESIRDDKWCEGQTRTNMIKRATSGREEPTYS